MTAAGVDVIDLTDSPSEFQAFPVSSGQTRALRLQKRARTETTSDSNSRIVISDGDEAPSPLVSSNATRATGKPEKKGGARRRKNKQIQPEEGEVAGDAVSQNASGSNSRIPTLGNKSSSPPLYYLDEKPEALPTVNGPADVPDASLASSMHTDSLLLPDHVLVDVAPRNRETAVITENSGERESDTDDFIHYADAELNVFQRYYEDPKDESERKAHLICGQCGAEGDHKQADCPVVVCLTCGAHNEHSTRQCPIVKTCFACGMKGHVSRDCPNKHISRRMMNRDIECARCGSDLHRSRECPTLWRMYDYMGDAERETTLKSRREKEDLPIGQGGEGYIGEDYWCYNCGNEGHLGDDCKIEPWHPESEEPSAYGTFNTLSGPFAGREHAHSDRRKLRREWELNGNFDDGHGFAGPSDVGKRGRDKERDRMRRREKEVQETQEDDDNWFNSRRDPNSGARPPSKKVQTKTSNEKVTLRFQNGGKTEKDGRRPADRLLDRISSGRKGEERGGKSDRDRHDSDPPKDHQGSNSKGRSNRDRERGQRRDGSRNSPYRDSAANHYRSSRGDRKRDEPKPTRQYYGSYAR